MAWHPRFVRLLRVDSSARCAVKNAEAANETGAKEKCADLANINTNMETIRASATRKSNGWAPTLEYQNGGRVIGQQRCETMEQACAESASMIQSMSECPEAFRNNHPGTNQLIELSNTSVEARPKAVASDDC